MDRHRNRTRAEIEQRGFSILPATFLQQEMEKLARDLEQSKLRRSKAGIRQALQHDGIRHLAAEPRLLGLAREILGHEAVPIRATLFDKSPQANWLVVWHQDTALPIREKHDAHGWVANNGPLRVLPGTHMKGVLTDDDIEELAGNIPPVDCLVPQGGVLAMRPLIVHASSKSQSQGPRRVVHIEYAACRSFDAGLELAIT